MGKVIDLVPFLKKSEISTELTPIMAKAINFEEHKNQVIYKERRSVKRTILSEVFSGMAILPEKGLVKIQLYDFSGQGLAFELEAVFGQFQIGEEVALRIYLNQKNYFPISVIIKHVQHDSQAGVFRHGAEFIKTAASDVALQSFAQFIEAMGYNLKTDSGDLLLSKNL